ncbi:MAG: GMC family oxidoreductase [Myxococcales bacterium]|nr:GMC family oxidoreductase [Myxococcales bacterium]
MSLERGARGAPLDDAAGNPVSDPYDLVVVGTSFASSFYLERYLRRAPSRARVLVLERGPRRSHAWRLAHRSAVLGWPEGHGLYSSAPAGRPWITHVELGGNSNCWWACTPRLAPEDFALRTRYGVAADWPITYDALEPHYVEAERLLGVAGDDAHPICPRSAPFPLPPHRLSAPDEALARAFPTLFTPQPCARPSVPTERRPRCCASGVCELCPVDAKFTVLNELGHLYEDPRVTLHVDARCESLVIEGGRVEAVRYVLGGRPEVARAGHVALGANALFNPWLLLRSGLAHPELGVGLHEQVGVEVRVDLDGLEAFGGGTSITGHLYSLYLGERRRDRAGALIEVWNVPELRMEPGRWRERVKLKVIFEDERRPESRVALDPDDDARPRVTYAGPSDWTRRGIDALEQDLAPVLAALPVERHLIGPPLATEAHAIGTTPMGDDPETSVLDARLVYRGVENLQVLGSGAFPCATPANPTLTLAALSLRAAAEVFG